MSMIAIAAACLTLQAPPLARPDLVQGSSGAFLQTFYRIEGLLAQGDYAAAKAASAVLPKSKVRYSIDWKGVPKATQPVVSAAFRAAFVAWQKPAFETEFVLVQSQSDIAFSFVETLPPQTGPHSIRGSVVFISDDPKEPRVESVIALKRGSPAVEADNRAFQNDAVYAVGAYFGVAEAPRFGTAMGVSGLPSPARSIVSAQDGIIARENIGASKTLIRAINEKKPWRSTRPKIQLDMSQVKLDDADQGDNVEFSIQVTNSGDRHVDVYAVADCACVGVQRDLLVRPKSVGMIRGTIDTVNFVGAQNHRIFLYTTDPEKPLIVVPTHIMIHNAYDVYGLPSQTVSVDELPTQFDLYLYVRPSSDVRPIDVRLTGLKGTAEMSEEPVPIPNSGGKSGYRVKVALPEQPLFGRAFSSLNFTTTSEKLRSIVINFRVQIGIVAQPERLFLGEILNAPRTLSVVVSRPTKPFKITKATVDSDLFTVEVDEKSPRDAQKLIVKFKGNAPLGELLATLIVETDDPKQKPILVPIEATVR